MTALSFIPTTVDTRHGRRIDFANVARLFGDVEELPRTAKPSLTRACLLALILLAAIGDTVLITRSDVLAGVLATAAPAPTSAAPVRS